jgi:hypothetical protein
MYGLKAVPFKKSEFFSSLLTKPITFQSNRTGFARSFSAHVPDFLHGAPPTSECAAFVKESRMKFASARRLDRKSGCTPRRTWGTRPIQEKVIEELAKDDRGATL